MLNPEEKSEIQGLLRQVATNGAFFMGACKSNQRIAQGNIKYRTAPDAII